MCMCGSARRSMSPLRGITSWFSSSSTKTVSLTGATPAAALPVEMPLAQPSLLSVQPHLPLPSVASHFDSPALSPHPPHPSQPPQIPHPPLPSIPSTMGVPLSSAVLPAAPQPPTGPASVPVPPATVEGTPVPQDKSTTPPKSSWFSWGKTKESVADKQPQAHTQEALLPYPAQLPPAHPSLPPTSYLPVAPQMQTQEAAPPYFVQHATTPPPLPLLPPVSATQHPQYAVPPPIALTSHIPQPPPHPPSASDATLPLQPPPIPPVPCGLPPAAFPPPIQPPPPIVNSTPAPP